MGFLQRIVKRHQVYYQTQREKNKRPGLKKVLVILLTGIVFLAYWMFGAQIYFQTIVSPKTLLGTASILTIIFFILCFFTVKNWKSEIFIITNMLIFLVHSLLFFSIALLTINYLSLDDDFTNETLLVEDWREHNARNKVVFAKIRYEDEAAELRFDDYYLDRVKNVKSLDAELNVGVLGYAYVKNYRIRE